MCKIALDEWQTVDPDQMLHTAASDLGLHCLPGLSVPIFRVITLYRMCE